MKRGTSALLLAAAFLLITGIGPASAQPAEGEAVIEFEAFAGYQERIANEGFLARLTIAQPAQSADEAKHLANQFCSISSETRAAIKKASEALIVSDMPDATETSPDIFRERLQRRMMRLARIGQRLGFEVDVSLDVPTDTVAQPTSLQLGFQAARGGTKPLIARACISPDGEHFFGFGFKREE